MSYSHALAALADPSRQRILERLRSGPAAAGRLGEGLAISQPAVSRHLRVLRESGLVRERREGARRIYSLDPAGLAPVRAWIEGFWDDALGAFADLAERTYEEDRR